MQIERLDHLGLTVRDLDATVAFREAIGFRHATFGDGRGALHVGEVRRPRPEPLELAKLV